MIFVCLGSREYQFDRLLRRVDEIAAGDLVDDSFYAQIGQSTYLPKHFDYVRFMDVDEFKQYQGKASLVISHGGTGALIGALKQGKQVIAVPRLAEFHEHTDDHQIQVSSVLEELGYLKMVLDLEELPAAINDLLAHPITKRYDRPSNVLDIVADYIKQGGSK